MTTECHPRGCRAARLLSLSILVIAAVFALPTSARAGALPLGATNQDVHLKGTQPGDLMDVIWPADICSFCHLGMDDPATTLKPWRWRGSLHSHATKDPIFQAGLAVARQDVGEATTFCYRCHSPAAWLEQRADPPTGELLTWEDFNHGVTCHVCHRLVNPVYVPGQSPADDELILGDLDSRGLLPTDTGSARYVVDPSDLRRGPFSDVNPPHPWAYSPFHTTGTLCGTCHDVSNPVFTRIGGATPAPNDTYELGAVNTPHPTGHDKDMYPEQRTYSEWLNSQFAATGVDMGGRFGGNNQVVRTCQDCHMEAVTGYGCDEKFFNPPLRQNLPYHGFTGANVTALDLLLHMYTPADFDNPGPNDFDQNTVTLVQRARGDTVSMLARATDLDLSVAGCSLRARITNQCGHKLLTGYPEGRRIWINVQFFDENNELIG
ncbi:MAG TPA: hypothetical protein VG797_06535, partial [Phycisphaerales bacterium]|nr:hypothetical protein [Phycisphaerales bacterium]